MRSPMVRDKGSLPSFRPAFAVMAGRRRAHGGHDVVRLAGQCFTFASGGRPQLELDVAREAEVFFRRRSLHVSSRLGR